MSNTNLPADMPEFVPSQEMVAVLMSLRAANCAALEFKSDKWDFAVSIRSLKKSGAGETDFRRLIVGRLAEHASEQSRSRSGRRTFRGFGSLKLTAKSCFVLAPAGERLLPPIGAVPRWDRELRKLWYGVLLVKEYRNPAESQETILSAFEEDGWPPRIDDPLPVVGEINPTERLHEAIRGLNRAQRNRLLTFRRDGTGEGVVWRGR
jgi:hypothetical protein